MNFYLGVDFGTSGARAVVIDEEGAIQAESQYPFRVPVQDIEIAMNWQTALFAVIEQIPVKLRREVRAISIDGTSSTVLLCDAAGRLVEPPMLYNDGRGEAVLHLLAIAPPNHTVLSATSSLAKLLWMTQLPSFGKARYFLHQADWLAFLLHGQLGISDYHNALKLGYDVEQFCYPAWITDIFSRASIQISPLLPKVLTPGSSVDEITAEIASRFELQRDCIVCAGTTDSIAAFLASGARSPGEAVTSLGSTLVLKLLSRSRVDDSRFGIYSHRLTSPSQEELWLTGGASNTGGAVLRQFFTDAQLEQLSRQIDGSKESYLDYYPLPKPGDRFPINDPHLPPRLEPRPDEPIEFLHGLLESLARIEAHGYHLLQQLGTTPLSQVYTAGGGAANASWAKIRARHLKVPLVPSVHTAAAYGTALLAMRGLGRTPK